jgi:mannose-6-phosphate isomerase
MLYPLTFQPIFKERIWGGRNLETLYQKALPPNLPIGESWEISDRPGEESVINNGPLAGKTLRWLMENYAVELLGPRKTIPKRFPLLVKILDAQATLSLQVHPPAALAPQLGGEPKTEMWFVAHAGPKAELFAGLKKGVTRAEFEKKIADYTVADCFHRLQVKTGDAMFIPSGRVHALGAENVIFEIQQNSDTTYRVFDWNRVDALGKSRQLHVAQSLASIDFEDFEPGLLTTDFVQQGEIKVRPLVRHELFEVNFLKVETGKVVNAAPNRMQIIGLLTGQLLVVDGPSETRLSSGQFCLIPASSKNVVLQTEAATSFLQVHLG